MGKTKNKQMAKKHLQTEDLRIVKTRRALHEALVSLLKEMDYSKITVTALAKEACVNRKTFYAHYQTPDDLVAELIASNIQRISEEAISDAAEKGKTGTAIIEVVTRHLLQELDESLRAIGKGLDSQRSVLTEMGFLKLAHIIIDPMEQIAKENPARLGLVSSKRLRNEISCYAGCLLAGYAQWRFENNANETLDDIATRVTRMTTALMQTQAA